VVVVAEPVPDGLIVEDKTIHYFDEPVLTNSLLKNSM